MTDPGPTPARGETRATLLRAAGVLLVVVAVAAVAFYAASVVLR